MYLLHIDGKQNRLHLTFSERIDGPQAESLAKEINDRIEEIEPGFHVLCDLTTMTELQPDARTHIRSMMELFNAKGAHKIIRIIPDPLNNFGLTVMSVFHYDNSVHIITCKSLKEALTHL